MYFHSMLEYKHQFECLLALCWINPALDLEAFPQASHGEGTFPMGLFSMWYYLIISYLIITFPMCLFLMCTLWHYIFLLFHTLYKPGLCPLLPLAFLRHHQILTRAFIPMWKKEVSNLFFSSDYLYNMIVVPSIACSSTSKGQMKQMIDIYIGRNATTITWCLTWTNQSPLLSIIDITFIPMSISPVEPFSSTDISSVLRSLTSSR